MLVVSRKVHLRQALAPPSPWKAWPNWQNPCAAVFCDDLDFFVLVPMSTFHTSKLVFVASGQCSHWYFLPAKSSHSSLMKHVLVGSRLQASTCEPRPHGRWVWMQSLVLDSVLELNSLRWSQMQSFFIWSFSFSSATLATEVGLIQSWAPCWPDLWLKFHRKQHKSGEESFLNQIKVGCNWVDARWSYWEARGDSIQAYMNRWNTKFVFLTLITWVGA